MSDYDDRFPAPVFTTACAMLRTKTQYYRAEDQAQPAGRIADSAALGYWCELTQDTIGPDRKGCDPGACQNARACFVAGDIA